MGRIDERGFAVADARHATWEVGDGSGRVTVPLPDVDAALSDELRVHALTLSHAHTLYLMAAHGFDSLEALAEWTRESSVGSGAPLAIGISSSA